MVGDLSGGGYEVDRLAEALARRDHEVRVFTVCDPESSDPESSRGSGAGSDSVAVDRLPIDTTGLKRTEDLVPLIGEIGAHLLDSWRSDPPQIVHCHGWVHGMAAQLAAKHCPVPTVQTFPGLHTTARRHRGDDQEPDTRTKLESLLARNASAVTVTCTDDMPDVIRLGCPRARVSVLAPGVEVDEVSAEEIVSRDDGPYRRIVAVARDFSPEQGLEQVLGALPSLGAAQLVLIATDGDHGQHGDRLQATIRTQRLGSRVRLVAGPADDDLCALFRSADVVVAPARYEPSSATVLQAMACGAPIVATAAGGFRDAVIDDVTGMLVPPGRADALARALRSILSQMVLRQGMGLAGRSRARSRYSWDRIATDTEVVYALAAGRELTSVG
ncbi:glycosyltransferase [Mycobacterium sp. smrl_JER01]|uniref:glycosyltransferase n=1 Tax=Mycobacterium sp. smrl_JER01 TaxID=3402633 RepID=UPI003AC9A28B